MGRTWFLGLALLASGAEAGTTGIATCQCLGALPAAIPDIDCTTAFAFNGKCVYTPGPDVPGLYPASYGESCQKHKEPGTTSCYNQSLSVPMELPLGQRATWCEDQWCYIDVCSCDDPGATQSFYWPDVSLFYSYSTCGATDAYTQETWSVVPGNEETCNPADDDDDEATNTNGTTAAPSPSSKQSADSSHRMCVSGAGGLVTLWQCSAWSRSDGQP